MPPFHVNETRSPWSSVRKPPLRSGRRMSRSCTGAQRNVERPLVPSVDVASRRCVEAESGMSLTGEAEARRPATARLALRLPEPLNDPADQETGARQAAYTVQPVTIETPSQP